MATIVAPIAISLMPALLATLTAPRTAVSAPTVSAARPSSSSPPWSARARPSRGSVRVASEAPASTTAAVSGHSRGEMAMKATSPANISAPSVR